LMLLAAILGFLEKQGDTDIAALAPEQLGILPASVPPTSVVEFPVAALRSALTAVCSNDAPDSDVDDWTQEQIDADFEAYLALQLSLSDLSDLSDRISVSSSAEHLHLAALLQDDPALRVELLDRAISLNPSDPMLIWGAVRICSDSGASVDCPLHDWEQRLIDVDGQNSESWVLVAANRYAAGEYDMALEAMGHASTAAESRAYWTETAEMIERGFAAVSDYAFPERAYMALGLATSKLPRYDKYATMCEEQSAKNVDWAYACVAYGELVEYRSKTSMDAEMAHYIQRLGLEALGETERAAAVEQRLQARRQERLDSAKEYAPATERLFFSNPSIFSAYLAAARSEGEVAARARITKEIERLLEQQPELACQPI